MKKLIVIICLVAMMGYGWYSYAQEFIEEGKQQSYASDLITEADGYMEKGLYQRAIFNYTEALDTFNTEDNWKKLINAYQKRYEEDTEILSDYISGLESAVSNFPTNRDFVVKLYDFYIADEDYQSAYNCLSYAENNGLTDDELKTNKINARYVYSENNLLCEEYIGLVGDTYTAKIENLWGAYSSNGSKAINFEYEYLSRGGYNDTHVYTTKKDSRLIDGDGIVLAIFPFKVTEAGTYSQGYVAVKNNGKYAFYDSLGEKAFGDYDYAGCFVNDRAAVKNGDKWYLIDKSGQVVSDDFIDIKLGPTGSYITNDVMVAKDGSQNYRMYDSNLNKIGELACEDMDYAAGSELIAFKRNGKWGYADMSGNIVIEPEYDEAKSFSNGLGAVCKDGKWGFINKQKELAINYVFDSADYFNADGSCIVGDSGSASDNESAGIWSIITLKLGV